jgi:hypothetical protein
VAEANTQLTFLHNPPGKKRVLIKKSNKRVLIKQVRHPPTRPSLRPLTLVRQVPEPWRVALSRHLPASTQDRLLADNFRNVTYWNQTKSDLT